MCLAIPMKIVRIDDMVAIAEANGVETAVNFALIPDLKVDDKVLIHAGFVIEKLDPEQAKEIEETWEEYYKIIEKENRKEA